MRVRKQRKWARPLAERFAENVAAPNENGCKLWTGTPNRCGYGRVMWGSGERLLAHRAAWMMERGPIPRGLVVCHRCDVPACVNIDHLFLGTQRENLDDMRAKGRGSYGHMTGERHGCSKLSLSQVREIREQAGAATTGLAARYGVSCVTIRKIRSGRGWRAALAEAGAT